MKAAMFKKIVMRLREEVEMQEILKPKCVSPEFIAHLLRNNASKDTTIATHLSEAACCLRTVAAIESLK